MLFIRHIALRHKSHTCQSPKRTLKKYATSFDLSSCWLPCNNKTVSCCLVWLGSIQVPNDITQYSWKEKWVYCILSFISMTLPIYKVTGLDGFCLLTNATFGCNTVLYKEFSTNDCTACYLLVILKLFASHGAVRCIDIPCGSIRSTTTAFQIIAQTGTFH